MDKTNNIYITTPIYYINDKPHIGHTYSTFTADILARFYRLLWFNTYFVTWTDENSQKTVEAAKSKLEILKKFWRNSDEKENLWRKSEENLKNYEDIKKLYQFIKEKELEKLLEDYLNWKLKDIPLELVQAYTDYMASIWRKTWENLKISFNDFIRTTEERHKKAVEKFYLKAKQNWYVYKWKYKGLYCWKCEAFYKESDLIKDEKTGKLLCPIHKYPVEEIEEENYFFKLTAFEKEVEKYLNENHIFPEFRKKELINNFLKEGLEDFSISREWKKWWIPFPDDPNHVFYVWYDALTNYLSVLWYAENKDLFEKFWDNWFIIHIIWKDIIKFHAIYWPAMLWAANEKAPDLIAAHWFFTINWEKISKSLGNAIPPTDLTDKYWIDAVRYYLFKDLKFWNDGDFSFERLHDLYNTNLLGWWWNLVSRVTKLAHKNNINQITKDELIEVKNYLSNQLNNFDFSENNRLKDLITEWFNKEIILYYLQNFDFQWYLNHWYELIQFTNKLIDQEKPWEKLKNEETKNEWIFILKTLLYLIRQLAILVAPILIESFEKIKDILGEEILTKIDTTSKIENIEKIFDLEELKFNLHPWYLYKKL